MSVTFAPERRQTHCIVPTILCPLERVFGTKKTAPVYAKYDRNNGGQRGNQVFLRTFTHASLPYRIWCCSTYIAGLCVPLQPPGSGSHGIHSAYVHVLDKTVRVSASSPNRTDGVCLSVCMRAPLYVCLSVCPADRDRGQPTASGSHARPHQPAPSPPIASLHVPPSPAGYMDIYI